MTSSNPAGMGSLLKVLVVAFCIIHWVNSDTGGYQIYSKCEGRLVSLTCDAGEVIEIKELSVQYGPLITDNMCLDADDISSNDTDCHVGDVDSYDVVNNLCHAKDYCSFVVNDDLFSLGAGCDVIDTMHSQLIFLYRCAARAAPVSTEASSVGGVVTRTLTLPTIEPIPPLVLLCPNDSFKVENCANWTCVDGLWQETEVTSHLLPPECVNSTAQLNSTLSVSTSTAATSAPQCTAHNASYLDATILWPDTSAGVVRYHRCPGNTLASPKNISRRCGGVGVWEDMDTSNCLQTFDDILHKVVKSDEDLEELSSQLVAKANTTSIDSEDIATFSQILTDVSVNINRFPSTNETSILTITQNCFTAAEKILSKPDDPAWSAASEENKTSQALLIASALENVARKAAFAVNSSFNISTCSIEYFVQVVNLSSRTSEPLSVKGKGVSITFPIDNFQTFKSTSNEYGKLVTVFYNSSSEIWGAQVVNSSVFSASLINSDKGLDTARMQLSNPFTYTLHHKLTGKDQRPKCVFWDESHQPGHWSEEGCRVAQTNKTRTVCECDHLTNFAILMDVRDSPSTFPEDHVTYLQIFTYVGCSISVICLLLSWLTFLCLKNLSSDRNTIHKHLVFTLMLAEALFLVAIYPEIPGNYKTFCSVLAGILHYLFLCVFAWTCLEGVQLYIMLIEVFEAEHSRTLYYYLAGYGIPGIVVSVSAAINPTGYGTEDACWLNVDKGFIWSFVGPVAVVMLVNIVMLAIAIYMMYNHARMTANMKHHENNKGNSIRAWFKGAVVLVILLGLTWTIGFVSISGEESQTAKLVMAYIFTILNSLQGLFIFIFHCILNDKVQKEYKKLVRRTQWLPDCFRAKYGEHRGLSSVPSHSSGSNGYLARVFSRRRKSADFITGSLRAKKHTSVNCNEEGCVNKEASTPLNDSVSSSNPQVHKESDKVLSPCEEKLVPTFC